MKDSRDILNDWRATSLVFWLPAFVLIAIGFFNISALSRALVWTVALTIMGAACLTNAFRCGRVHCFLTGPFFLLMAIVSLLYGLGFVPSISEGWNVIGLVTLIGAVSLWWISERFGGKYRASRDLS